MAHVPTNASNSPEPLVPLSLTINGDPLHLAVRPSQTLLEMLRYQLDLIGTKQGCDKGDCGACTVLVDGASALACLTLAVACAGRTVTTVESLAGAPRVDPLLDAFDRFGAGQCGFCTPGMLMTAKGLLAHQPKPSKDTIRHAISGNLCRCTGYGPIVEAIASVGDDLTTAQGSEGDDPQAGLSRPLPPYAGPKP